MKTLVRLLAGIALSLCVSSGQAAPPASPGAPQAVGPTRIALAAQDPMAAEMQREIELWQVSYAALFHRLATARSEKEAFEYQQDMAQHRVALQVTLLQIQSAYARRAHRERFAAQLDELIAELVSYPARSSGIRAESPGREP